MTYNYSDELFSDFHKDVYGFRPDCSIRFNWEVMSRDQKQARWNQLSKELESKNKLEKQKEEEDVQRFKANIEIKIRRGAKDRTDALRIMTENEDFQGGQCVECWVWDRGILFTPYGKELVQELCKIVTYS